MKVFLSYARKDNTKYRDDLKEALQPLKRSGEIDLWIDERIQPGDDWQKEIEAKLHGSDTAILLVSRAFYASDYILDQEIPVLLRKQGRGELTLIPVFIEHAPTDIAFRYTDHNGNEQQTSIAKIEGIATPEKPLYELDEPSQDRLWQ